MGIIFTFFIILSISSVSSLIISEVESNPEGTDTKHEWIELYSEEEINGNYILANNDAGEIYDSEDKDQLKIHFNFVGYYVYNFNGQWLDNSDEKVYLYDESERLIDSTNIFDDGGDSNFTWQRCDDTWIFEEQTRGEINCVIEEPPEEEPEINETEEIVEEENSILTGSIIKLDSKDIKSKKNSKELDKNNFATIGLGLVVILLLFLLVSQRYKRTKKNEFR